MCIPPKISWFSQIEAIRSGLLQVVPEAVLELFAWHEIEKRICGDPEITFETLRKNSQSCYKYYHQQSF